jgi:hypothetical protein
VEKSIVKGGSRRDIVMCTVIGRDNQALWGKVPCTVVKTNAVAPSTSGMLRA